MITAVDASPGQVDDRIGAFQLVGPQTGRTAVPNQDRPGYLRCFSRKHDDLMPVPMEIPGQDRADMSAASGNDDLHGPLLPQTGAPAFAIMEAA